MSPHTYLPIVGGLMFALGLSILSILLAQIVRCAKKDDRGRRYRPSFWQSDFKRLLAITAGLLVIGIADLTFWVNTELRRFTPIAAEQPVGMVGVVDDDGGGASQLVLSKTDLRGHEVFEIIPVRGPAFRLRGERIRLLAPLSLLEIDDFLKITRVEFHGGNESTDQSVVIQSVEVGSGPSALYAGVRRLGSWLPLIVAEPVTSVSYESAEEFTARLFVDSSGLSLQ